MILKVKVISNSKMSKIVSNGKMLKVFVKESLKSERVNKSVIKLLSTYFKTKQSKVKILSGIEKSEKIVEVKI